MEDTLNQLSKAYMNAQTQKQQVQSLHGTLPGHLWSYYSFQLNIFCGTPEYLYEWVSDYCLLLGVFSFCLVALFGLDVMTFALSNYISFLPCLVVISLIFLVDELKKKWIVLDFKHSGHLYLNYFPRVTSS